MQIFRRFSMHRVLSGPGTDGLSRHGMFKAIRVNLAMHACMLGPARRLHLLAPWDVGVASESILMRPKSLIRCGRSCGLCHVSSALDELCSMMA